MNARLDVGLIRPIARRLVATPDPLALFRHLTEDGARPDTLLFESADATTGQGERSVLIPQSALRLTCVANTVRIEALTGNGRALLPWLTSNLPDRGATRVDHQDDVLRATFPMPRSLNVEETARTRADSPLDAIRAVLFGPQVEGRPSELSHIVAGIFAYDLLDLFERLPPAREDLDGFPHFECWVPEQLVLIDHVRRATVVQAMVVGGADSDRRYHDAMRAVQRLVEAVTTVEGKTDLVGGPRGSPPGVGVPNTSAIEFQADQTDDEFAVLVRHLQEYIRAGDVFQIVPSRTFTAPCPDPLLAYTELRAANPSPYMFWVRAPEYLLFGASPETCVKVTTGPGPERQLMIRPIAGTVARGRAGDGTFDLESDTRNEAALRTDAKELAEHMMLVDLARNDVARVSKPGTRRVARLLSVERYSRVMHLVSEVVGDLRDDLDALHAYAASMNMGTLVGAPKVRAAQLLRQVERTRRGPYGGAVGYLTSDGSMDTAIIIRSALVRDGVAQIRAGAGIVEDSVPEREANETKQKVEAVLRAIALATEASCRPA